jgi:parvulin-like peptidyl-prolyl isomerase
VQSAFLQNLPPILASVEGVEITANEFRNALTLRESSRQMQANRAGTPTAPPTDVDRYRILEMMVEDKAAQFLANSSGIEVAEADVDTLIEQEKQRFGGEAGLKIMMDRLGLTPEEHRSMRREFIVRRLYAQGIIKDVTVTQEELRGEYQKLLVAGLMNAPERASNRHILLRVQGDEAAWEATRLRMTQIRDRIVTNGEDFGTVAMEVSEDVNSRQQGGLGQVYKAGPENEFTRTAFALPLGDVSEPFRTTAGWHIMTVETRYPASTMPFDSVKDRLMHDRLSQKRRETLQNHVKESMKSMDVQILVSPPPGYQGEEGAPVTAPPTVIPSILDNPV